MIKRIVKHMLILCLGSGYVVQEKALFLEIK